MTEAGQPDGPADPPDIPAWAPDTHPAPPAAGSLYSPQGLYNPTPPVKPVIKKSSGCLGMLAGVILIATLVALLVALVH